MVQSSLLATLSKGENEMRRYLLLAAVLFGALCSAGNVFAVEIADAVITTAVVDREPVDAVEAFPVQNGKLYCFTRVVGAEEPTFVYHLWYRENQLMSRVELPVKSSSWRTWSAKNLLEDGPGDWRVEIQDASGRLLQKLSFKLR
jgi:hypothetical protein